jgi:hypothetical protein
MLRKISRLVAFVRTSERLLAEGIGSTLIKPSRTVSRMKWYLTRKCLVFECQTLSCDNLLAASLSQYSLVPGCPSASDFRSPRPWRSSLRNMASRDAPCRAIYSA